MPGNGRHSPADPEIQVRPGWYAGSKAWLDFLAALVLAAPVSVVTFLAAVLVKVSSHGPAFYTQVRVGRFGRPFTIYKIRTMIHNCEGTGGAQWSVPGDKRVTRIGRILRKLHIDELPQLLNVLRGEMSLVGPRPERPEFVGQLALVLPNYYARLQVRPGVTGLAQIQLPPDTDLESVRRKLAFDIYYVQHLGLWLDFRVCLGTLFYLCHLPCSWGRSLLGIPGSRKVEAGRQGPVPPGPPD